MTPENIELVQKSFATALQSKAELADRVYFHLFEEAPELRTYFAGSDLAKQRTKITSALVMLVKASSMPGKLDELAFSLARSHARFDLNAQQFHMMARAIIAALSDCLGDDFTPDLHDAWQEAFDGFLPRIANAMESPEIQNWIAGAKAR